MKQNKTYIYCVLDRSGSMSSIINDSIGGFNEFLTQQKQIPGECEVSINIFDDHQHLLINHKQINDVQPLTKEVYYPRGGTALYDAIGCSINSLGEYLSNLPEEERPEKVLFVILTDGEENQSKQFSGQQISNMISHQRDVYSWEFIFLAANQDALSVADTLSISKGNSMNFMASSMGTRSVYSSMSDSVSNYRSKAKKDVVLSALFNDAGIDNTKTAE